MGRQIGFYFGDKDEKEFLEVVNTNDVVFLRDQFKRKKIEFYKEFNINPAVNQSKCQAYICFRSDLKSVGFFGDYKAGIILLDIFKSPVIEFERSGLKPDINLLISGRLWYEHKYWTEDKDGNDVLLEKSKELERLYNSLARWIRKHCTRLDDGYYIAPHAMELHKKGAKLSG